MGRIKWNFSDFSVKSKLLVLIGIFIISLVLLGSVVNLLFRSSQTMTIVINVERVFIENFDKGIEHFYRYEITGDTAELKQSYAHLNKSILIASSFGRIDSILNSMSQSEWAPILYDIYKEGVDYDMQKLIVMGNMINMFSRVSPDMLEKIQIEPQLAAALGRNLIAVMESYSKENTQDKLDLINSEFERLHVLTNNFASKIYDLNEYVAKRLLILLILLVLILGTGVTIISIRIANSISYPVNKLLNNFKKIAKGNLTSSVTFNTRNEIGELSNAFLEIQQAIQGIIAYSKKVALGDYSEKLVPRSDEDEFTIALNQMVARLEETKINTEKAAWIQTGITGLDDQMRGNYTVRELSSRILVYLNKFLQVETGAVYVFDDVPEHLELTGSLGLNKELLPDRIKPGEGLIGAAAMQKELQVLDTKDKFRKTYSASGEIEPAKIYLMPLYNNGKMQAVIELAPIHEFNSLKLEFLKSINEQISINLGAAVARFRINELLNNSLEQAKILEERDKELSRQLEENKAIQKNLQRETVLLNSMLRTLPDYIYFKDPESRFLRISESMAGLFNAKNSQEIIGKTDFDYHPPKDAKRYYEEEQQIIRNGKGMIDVIRHGINENGDELWTSVTKLPMYDDEGTCIGTFGISKDVTHIKKLEVEVHERNEKLKQQQEELQQVNQRLVLQQEELKATNEELKSQEEELRVANEELAEQTKILVESEKNLQMQQEELRVANEELETKTIQLEQQKYEITAKNERLIKTQKELEQKAKELAQASQYKSEFLANMSHELRTPLNSLLILSKLLAANKKGNLSDEQIKSIEIIHKSGKDLLELINEILDLSKIEAGKMRYELSEIPAEDITNEISQGFEPVAQNKNLELQINVTSGFPERIYTDRQRLMQVLKNLLSNAFKFTSSGGVTVTFGIPEKTTLFINPLLNSDNAWYIAVKDTGVGIPKGKVDAIFEAFQQADGSISRRFGGTGLGLSISKQLIQALGGEIHVESSEGVGSVFTIYLPKDKDQVNPESHNQITEEPQKEITPVKEHDIQAVSAELLQATAAVDEEPWFIPDDRNTRKNGLMVLIIHNEKEKASKLISLSHNRNFSVLAAADIADGIKLAEKYKPEAIILSAELGGTDKINNLKQNSATKNLPVHLVTRVEDTILDNIEELRTPESEEFDLVTKNIESKLNSEYRQVLVVEDDEFTRKSIQMLFENKDMIIHEAKTGQQAYDMISTKNFDCVILDLGLPDFTGNELLKKLNQAQVAIPNVVIHTARDLTHKELRELQQYSDSIVIKGVKSDERLMDEVTLFLHHVENRATKTRIGQVYEDDVSSFKGKKVLVVDDDIRNVFALAQILEEREIEVLEAENGEIALEMLKKTPDINLVLMDIMMPVMNGYEAMKIIRETPETENIPIITLTAKAMKEDYQKAIDCGANDYISKPIEIDKLISLLKIWLFK